MTDSTVRQATMARFFELLGAPLNNTRWSCGARRPDGAVFLAQWETDGVVGEDGRELVVIAHGSAPAGPRQHGWRERLEHKAAVRCRTVWESRIPVGETHIVPLVGAAGLYVQMAAADSNQRPMRQVTPK